MKVLRKTFVGVLGVTLSVMTWIIVPAQVNSEVVPLDTLPNEIEAVPQNLLKPRTLQAVQPGTDVNVSNLVGNESEVSIDVNPTNSLNQVVVGHAPGFVTMNTFFTQNGGQTWTLVALGNAADGLTSTFRFDPSVTFDENGNVFVAYGVRTPVPAGTGNQTTVVVCRSTNGGQTYQCTQVATTANIGGTPGNDKWQLTPGPDPNNPSQQNVYIAWTQNISEPAGLDQRIVVSASTDGGVTFSTPRIINDASINGTSSGNLFADPAVGPNGQLYVSWHAIAAHQILVDVSFDGGVTFGTDNLVTTESVGFKTPIPPQPDRGVFAGPMIDTDRSGGPFNGRLYMTYVNTSGLPDTNIFVRFSDNNGTTWSAPTRVNDDGGTNSQFLPWLDVDQQTGLVSVVWYDARNDPNNQQVEVFTALSDNGGVTFRPNTLVSDHASDQSTANASRTTNNYLEYIGVASFRCQVFPVWSDNSTNRADLDYFTDHVQITGRDTPLCNQPPVCNANGPYVAECGQNVTLDGSGSSDPDGDLLTFSWTGPFTPSPVTGEKPTVVFSSPTGNKTVTLEVKDTINNPQQCNAQVTVQDTLPPTITAVTATPNVLWPPNHEMVPVTVAASTSDICDKAPICRVISVSSNEPINGTGDGDTAPDWEITGDLTVNLRAERAGNGSGRVYTLTAQCSDASGNSAMGTTTVTVPHNQ